MSIIISIALIVGLGVLFGLGIYQFNDSDNHKDIKVSDHYNGKKFVNPTLEEQFSPGFSEIFKMMRQGRPSWPDSVVNEGVPQIQDTIKPGDLSITFVNHATFLIQTSNLNILTDPVWSERASPISWIGPKRVRKPGIKIEELPNIDLILLSHNHYDHLDIETLGVLNEYFKPKVIVPIGDKELVESIGITNVKELDWWESVQVNPTTRITFTPQQHSSARGLFDRDKSLWGSYFIQLGDRSVFFGGDGGYSKHFADIKDRMGSPEIAILGIGAYEPDFFMKAIHTSPAEAVRAHLDLGATQSIGMHFGTFQLASEEFEQPLIDLRNAMVRHGLENDTFITLSEGETRMYKHQMLAY